MNDNDALTTSNRLRDHHPEPFISAYKNAESEDERAELRSKLKRIDSGRWYDVLADAHTHLAHCDYDARMHMDEIYSQTFRQWVAAYGMVEDLNTFSKFTGIEK